jgi:hypothetical protein
MHYGVNHFRTACFVMFFLGQFLHAWLQASEAIQDKNNGISGYRQYMDYRAPQVMARFFCCYLLFGSWQLGYLAAIIGALVPGAEAFMSAHPHPIPVNQITAGAFGFLADFALRYGTKILKKKFPGIEKDLPPADDTKPAVGDK